ncbi:MAG: gamma-glutamylcyclotransferase family protein [Myxococcota bacterium]
MALLFTYGTLMVGEVAHHRLAGQRFIGPAVTQPGYRLYRMSSWYPAMVIDEASKGRVAGEIYAIDSSLWPSLDAYEDCPAVYRRLEVRLDGGPRPVLTYVVPQAVMGGAPLIESGSWRARK